MAKSTELAVREGEVLAGAQEGGEEQGKGEPVEGEVVEGELGRLSAAQRAALRELGAGASIVGAARSAGVTARTVHRWLRGDAEFAAAFNAWKREVLDSGRAQALAMMDAAMATVGQAIAKGNVKAALELVKRLGVLGEVRVGETDGRRVKRKRAVWEVRREKKLAKAEREFDVVGNKPVETTAEVDGKIREWFAVRDRMVMENEQTWLSYEALMALGETRVRKETGRRWPDGPPECVRPVKEEVREAIVRTAKREGKSIEAVEWWMQAIVPAEKRRYFSWAEVGADTKNWHDSEPREGAPGKAGRRGEGASGGGDEGETQGEAGRAVGPESGGAVEGMGNSNDPSAGSGQVPSTGSGQGPSTGSGPGVAEAGGGGGEKERGRGVSRVRDERAPYGWVQNSKGERVPRGKPVAEERVGPLGDGFIRW